MGNVAGMEGLRQNLESLKTNAARNALRHASRKAGLVVRNAAEAAAPIGDTAHWIYKGPKGRRTKYRLVAPGFLSRNVISVVRYLSRKGAVLVRIGPRSDAFYGTQFVELGTSKVPKRAWLVPAYEAARVEVEQTFVRELRAAIARAVKRGQTR